MTPHFLADKLAITNLSALARAVGVTRTNLWAVFSSDSPRYPSFHLARRLSRVLDVSMDDLADYLAYLGKPRSTL